MITPPVTLKRIASYSLGDQDIDNSHTRGGLNILVWWLLIPELTPSLLCPQHNPLILIPKG